VERKKRRRNPCLEWFVQILAEVIPQFDVSSLQGLPTEESAIDLDIGPPLDAGAARNYKTIKEIFTRLMRLCVQGSGVSAKPRKHEQRLLRNMGAHSVVLELLQIPYDKVMPNLTIVFNAFNGTFEFRRMIHGCTRSCDWPMNSSRASVLETSLTRRSCTRALISSLLQGYVLGYWHIQDLNLDLVCLLQLLEAETVRAIFQDNIQLCNEVTERVVQHFVHCIETHGRHVQYLRFLQTIVKSEGNFIRKCQDTVMAEVGIRKDGNHDNRCSLCLLTA
jgi:inositol 1,4,5-triphosphate receptor type 1